MVYCNGETDDLSLKSIQTLSRLYPLPHPYPIQKLEIIIQKIPLMDKKISFLSQNVNSLRSDSQKENIDIMIDIMARKKIDVCCIQETWLDGDSLKKSMGIQSFITG